VPRTCTICCHPQRLQIEQAILSGTSLRIISERFGTAKTNIFRHREHVSESLARHTGAEEFVRTGVLLDDVRAGEGRAERLYQKAEEILTSALQDKDRRTALQAIKVAVDVMSEARSYLELRGELTNELGRERALPALQIQIVCPASDAAMPRFTYASADELDGEDVIQQIGVLQRP
jgi:hypothetical protein